MKTVVFILVILKGSEVMEEAEIGNYQDCSWHMSLINKKGTGSPYSAYCKPKLKRLLIEMDNVNRLQHYTDGEIESA